MNKKYNIECLVKTIIGNKTHGNMKKTQDKIYRVRKV